MAFSVLPLPYPLREPGQKRSDEVCTGTIKFPYPLRGPGQKRSCHCNSGYEGKFPYPLRGPGQKPLGCTSLQLERCVSIPSTRARTKTVQHNRPLRNGIEFPYPLRGPGQKRTIGHGEAMLHVSIPSTRARSKTFMQGTKKTGVVSIPSTRARSKTVTLTLWRIGWFPYPLRGPGQKPLQRSLAISALMVSIPSTRARSKTRERAYCRQHRVSIPSTRARSKTVAL